MVGDKEEVVCFNGEFLVSCESVELWVEMVQMGYLLCCLIKDLGDFLLFIVVSIFVFLLEVVFFIVWVGIVVVWWIVLEVVLIVYLWLWVENQVMVVLKVVLFGQVFGQWLFVDLGGKILDVVVDVLKLLEIVWFNFMLVFVIVCVCYEIQYLCFFRL